MSLSAPKKNGFTLIELLVVIGIIAILAAVGLTTYTKAQVLARDSRRKQDLAEISKSLELYNQVFKHYPCTLGADTTVGWINSKDFGANWITNSTTSPIIGCGSGSDIFDASYMKQIPADPINITGAPYSSATAYNYSYWAGTTTCNGKTGYGVTYILVAQLENKLDADRIGAKSLKWCGIGASGTTLDGSVAPVTSPTAIVVTGES